MKGKGTVIILLILISGLVYSCKKSVDTQIEEVLLQCITEKFEQEGIDLKTELDRYERNLVNNEILNSGTGKGYHDFFKKWADTEEPYHIGYYEGMEKLTQIPPAAYYSEGCLQAAAFDQYDSLEVVGSKMYQYRQKMHELANQQDMTVNKLAGAIVSVLSPEDFDRQYYRTIALLAIANTSLDDRPLIRRLPQPTALYKQIPVKKRDVMTVRLDSNNRLFVYKEHISVDKLKGKVKEFIQNPDNNENLPELADTILPNTGQVKYTKYHIISFQNEKGTAYQSYVEVQNELIAAYRELRDELAFKKFGMPYDKLPEEIKDEIKIIYNQHISETIITD